MWGLWLFTDSYSFSTHVKERILGILEFWTPGTGFGILYQWNVDSGFQSLMDFRFLLKQNSGFQSPGFQIPQVKISRIRDSKHSLTWGEASFSIRAFFVTDVSSIWIVLPFIIQEEFRLIAAVAVSFFFFRCDFLLISDGRKTLKITDGFKVRRCHGYKCYYDEPSSYDESANKDNGNFYNDDVDDDFYYYYDEKRNEDEDGWKTFWVSKRRRLIIVQGGNRHVIIKFKSKGCGSAKGFSVRYDKKRQKRSRGEFWSSLDIA